MGPGTSHVGLGFEKIRLDCSVVGWCRKKTFEANLDGQQIVTPSASIEKKFPHETTDTSDNVLSLDSKK